MDLDICEKLDQTVDMLCSILSDCFSSLFASIYSEIGIFQMMLLSLFAVTKLLCNKVEIGILSILKQCVLLFMVRFSVSLVYPVYV